MEYERALYRIYEISLESLLPRGQAGTTPQQGPALCMGLRKLFFTCGMSTLLVLTLLHREYVNEAGNLEERVTEAAHKAGVLMPPVPGTPFDDRIRQYFDEEDLAPPADAEAEEEDEDGNNDDVRKKAGKERKYVTLSSGARIPEDLLIAFRVEQDMPLTGDAFADMDSPSSFLYSASPIVLLLPEETRKRHDFLTLNVTLDASGGPFSEWLVDYVVGYNTVVLNQVMFTFRTHGMMQRQAEPRDEWWWSSSQVPPRGGKSFPDAIAEKATILIKSIIAFSLLSAITALIVRVLLSSGVSIMYPLLMLLRYFGVACFDMRVLTVSYPWLGVPIEALRRRNRSPLPFIMGHIALVVVLYFCYSSSEMAWSAWIYQGTVLEVWIYGTVLIWEYYALFFVRSEASMSFFPRLTALYFVLFHIYVFSYPGGYVGIAALVNFLFLCHAMVYCVLKLEIPALSRGEISFERPRSRWVELPYPALGAVLPPMWSIFVPPNTRASSVYHIGRRRRDAAAERERNRGTATADIEAPPPPPPSSGRARCPTRRRSQCTNGTKRRGLGEGVRFLDKSRNQVFWLLALEESYSIQTFDEAFHFDSIFEEALQHPLKHIRVRHVLALLASCVRRRQRVVPRKESYVPF